MGHRMAGTEGGGEAGFGAFWEVLRVEQEALDEEQPGRKRAGEGKSDQDCR